jgi:hypothetical protein
VGEGNEENGEGQDDMMGIKTFIKLKILTKICTLGSCLTGIRLPATIDELPYEVPYYLDIPTYEKSGQAVHPDVWHDKSTPVPYVLAFTPYPFSMDAYENPSIAVSQDGLRFREEVAGINPLAGKPSVDHNDDPDMFLHGGAWNIVYLETMRPRCQNLVLLESPDRIHWSRRLLYTANLRPTDAGSGDSFIVSPAFIEYADTCYFAYVNISASPHRIEIVPADRELNPDFSSPLIPSIDGYSENPWHVDILNDRGTWYMLLCSVASDPKKGKVYSLSIARSTDLSHWQLSLKRLLPISYRATGYIEDDDLVLYFSRQKGILSAWKIGVYKTRLSEYF